MGASVVNALSEYLTVEIVREGKKYREEFKNGGHPVGSLKKIGKTKQANGTVVTFKPDKQIFTTTVFNFNTLSERLRESAFLLKGVKITLTDERENQEQTQTFLYEEGIKEFVTYLNEDKDTLGDVLYFDGSKEGVEVEIAAQYTDGYSENVLSFVNNVRTKDGGTHEVGMRSVDQSFQRICSSWSLKEKTKISRVVMFVKDCLRSFHLEFLKNSRI